MDAPGAVLNPLTHELRKAGLSVEQQRGITVMYDGVAVGEYVVDLLVELKVRRVVFDL